jgi:ribosomal protein S18 acetylase RimI-like enzyme
MGILIRPLEQRDRRAVREILTSCGAFSDEEVGVALELIDEGVAGGLAGTYAVFGAESDSEVRGYACVGRISLTRATWHLYWIAVHPAFQRRCIGRTLQAFLEEFIRSLGGERLTLETSSRIAYERTRDFYQRAGYTQVGYIRDYYKAGDDCVMYCKVLFHRTHDLHWSK